MSYNVPTYGVPFLTRGEMSTTWYRFFQNLWSGVQPSNETKVPVGASPFPYTAPSKGFVILSGGSVSAVQFTRSVTTLTGLTSGIFPLNQGDVLTVTYGALPSMTFVPT